MSEDAAIRQAEKLIGGWVAGTLTPAERASLLEASLHNQTLFDALADEEGLRELLADPAVRRELAAVLSVQPAPAVETWWQRIFNPAPMAAFSAGVLAVVAFVAIRPEFIKQKSAEPATVAKLDVAKDIPAAPPPEVPAEKRAPAKPQGAVARVRRDEGSLGRTAPRAVASDDKREVETDRLNKVAEPVAVAAPAPPPAQPATALTGAAEALADSEVKAKRASTAVALPALPIRYRIERLQAAGGEWVEYGGELSQGAQARLAIEATQPGALTVRAGGEVLIVAMRAGQTVHFPASGNLPSGAGEREVAILFRPGAAAQTLAAAPIPVQSYKLRQQQQQTGGGGAGQQQQLKEAAGPAAPQDYAVTVRLRFR